MGSWADAARDTIAAVHAELPADASLEQRTKAVDAAYPFGERAYSPYKTWLRARKEYLARYGYQPRGHDPLTPLERAIAEAAANG